MKLKALFATLLLIYLRGFANEKVTISIQGMHCGSCVKALNKKVCQDLALENCEVSLTDRKKEIGQISFSKKEGLDLSKVKAVISEAGYKPTE
jgi:copper chaperone CopZ